MESYVFGRNCPANVEIFIKVFFFVDIIILFLLCSSFLFSIIFLNFFLSFGFLNFLCSIFFNKKKSEVLIHTHFFNKNITCYFFVLSNKKDSKFIQTLFFIFSYPNNLFYFILSFHFSIPNQTPREKIKISFILKLVHLLPRICPITFPPPTK